MKDKKTGAYYLHHVPQSEYRRLREDHGSELHYLLDIELADLKISNEGVKLTLREKIKTEGEKIVQAVVPEEKWEEILDGQCFRSIYKKLGI